MKNVKCDTLVKFAVLILISLNFAQFVPKEIFKHLSVREDDP